MRSLIIKTNSGNFSSPRFYFIVCEIPLNLPERGQTHRYIRYTSDWIGETLSLT